MVWLEGLSITAREALRAYCSHPQTTPRLLLLISGGRNQNYVTGVTGKVAKNVRYKPGAEEELRGSLIAALSDLRS